MHSGTWIFNHFESMNMFQEKNVVRSKLKFRNATIGNDANEQKDCLNNQVGEFKIMEF